MQQNVEIVNSFRAMNTEVKTILCILSEKQEEGEKALEKVQNLFLAVEGTLSRFKGNSELSILNASSGRPFRASPLLFEVVKTALSSASATDGIFDPTVLGDLLSAGYDRSFEKLAGQRVISGLSLQLCADYTWRNIILDESSSTIYLPPGCGIDLGGIGKGWAVDRASLILESFTGYALDAGGDIRIGGKREDGSRWTAGIADPFDENRNLMVVELNNEAICTSTTMKRKWQSAGDLRNHIIDPRTGLSTKSGVVSVTIIADSAARAETVAKSALILGPEDGLYFIENQPGIRVLMILDSGETLTSPGLREMVSTV
jgi:FAD:protein FMN transferase